MKKILHVLTSNFSHKLVIGLIRSELKAFVLNGNRGNSLAIVNCIFKKTYETMGKLKNIVGFPTMTEDSQNKHHLFYSNNIIALEGFHDKDIIVDF